MWMVCAAARYTHGLPRSLSLLSSSGHHRPILAILAILAVARTSVWYRNCSAPITWAL
jgi:hypothetical protein